ncbi:hypothetical protein OROHE_016698 [Orobanche hederae]
MVGLSVILENYRDLSENRSPQVISKGSMIKPSSPTATPNKSPNGFSFSRRKNISKFSSVSGFLEYCFLCKQKLSPGKDIYMYKGDEAFCSVECRYRQIFMDEEESSALNGCTREYKCSLAATTSSSSPSPSPSSSSSSRRGPRNRAHAFAY